MRAWLISIFTLLQCHMWASAALPTIPTPNEVIRYERLQPVFLFTQISKERGDALLAALAGGRHIQERQTPLLPPGAMCGLTPPPKLWLTVTRTNGSKYRLGVCSSLVYLPEGFYEITAAAREKVANVVGQLEDDLRRDIVSAPRPCPYKIGTIDDGGTLSGVARLFYGDATKWPRIYDANRAVLRSPHQIAGSERLTIPKL